MMRASNNQPFWLPRGSIKATLAVLIVSGTMLAVFLDKPQAVVAGLVPLAVMVLRDFFSEGDERAE